MINLDILPCMNCIFYSGIIQPFKKEENEYIACNKAESKKAMDLLYIRNRKYFCNEYKQKDEV